MNAIPVEISKSGWTLNVKILGHKLPRIDEGSFSCRKVFRWGDYVVKTDGPNSDPEDWTENQCWLEVHNWINVIPRKDRRYFATLIDYGISNGSPYVIQKYIPKDNCQYRSMPKDIWDLISGRIGISDLSSARPTGNWHWYKNVPIVVDYASVHDVGLFCYNPDTNTRIQGPWTKGMPQGSIV